MTATELARRCCEMLDSLCDVLSGVGVGIIISSDRWVLGFVLAVGGQAFALLFACFAMALERDEKRLA